MSKNLKINYSSIFDRLSLIVDNEFISLSITSFKIWMILIEQGGPYERVIINQTGSDIIFTQINGCFAINFNSVRGIFNRIILSKDETLKILNNKAKIFEIIENLRNKQRKNVITNEEISSDIPVKKRGKLQDGDVIDTFRGLHNEHEGMI